MESIYYVMSWLCHRKCTHCYDERFRPYHGEELERVLSEAMTNAPRVIANLPARMTYLDRNDPDGRGGFKEKIGRIILAGGEVLLQQVREAVLYPTMAQLVEKYRAQGGVKLIIQTTGDQLSPCVIEELLKLGVWMISVSGIDAYHLGLETEVSRDAVQSRLKGMLETAGLKHFQEGRDSWNCSIDSGPWYSFWGATPGSWIGKLWPRGRAMENELSTAGMADNFCNAWSGGLNFLQAGYSGSEVSIDPQGNVYPCCIKTRRPLGSLLDASLDEILQSVAGNSVYAAISSGHPERMGIQYGWTEEKFLEMSATRLPSGQTYRNLCMGCDRFHEEVLSAAKVCGFHHSAVIGV